MDFDNLNEQQKVFAKEYVLDWNATRAAKAAGYSEKTAYSIGHNLLKKIEIQKYIEHVQKDIQKLIGISKASNANALLEIALKPDARDADRIKAREVINKMLGFNEAEKVEEEIKIIPPKINFFEDDEKEE